ncbi:MAG TPA: twin-arginine translocase TatA/TatE family subunit [Acidobacteriaceae bacterium]|nr:twin-arginine translocase TatA/TatE family subunit [Acidobacteriaceae bacterium]
MHFADSIVIFLLALILFGPKKLPEIARQIGKLMVEFRRASNEFKSQIDEELRNMEMQERQKKLEAQNAAVQTPVISAPEGPSLTTPNAPPENALPDYNASPELSASPEEVQPVILPPSTGEPVSAARPFMPVASQELLDAAAVDPHPVYAEALAAEQNGNSHSAGPVPENSQAAVNHG